MDRVDWTEVKRKGQKQRGRLVSWLKDAVMSDIENKVRAATSVEEYGVTQREMAEIAAATHNAEDYPLIMGVIWSRLNDQGRYWRRVYKALDLLRYLALHGSPRVLDEARTGVHHLQALQEFRYFDPREKRDCGLSVRQRAKLVLEIVTDPRRFEEEQQRSLVMRQKMSASVGSNAMGIPAYAGYAAAGGGAYVPNAADAASFGGFAGFEPRASSLEAERRGPLAAYDGRARSHSPPPSRGPATASLLPESTGATTASTATRTRGPTVDDLLSFEEAPGQVQHNNRHDDDGEFKQPAAVTAAANDPADEWGDFTASATGAPAAEDDFFRQIDTGGAASTASASAATNALRPQRPNTMTAAPSDGIEWTSATNVLPAAATTPAHRLPASAIHPPNSSSSTSRNPGDAAGADPFSSLLAEVSLNTAPRRGKP